MTFWPPAALLHDYLGGLLVIYGSIIYLGKEWRIGIGARFFLDIDILIFGLIHGFFFVFARCQGKPYETIIKF